MYCGSVFSWSLSLDAAKQVELACRGYRTPKLYLFFFPPRQADKPWSQAKPSVRNPMPKIQLSDHVKMNRAAPGPVLQGRLAWKNRDCKTFLGDRKRNGNNDAAEPDHKHLLKGPVTASPSAAV